MLHRISAPLLISIGLLVASLYPVGATLQYQWSGVNAGEWWRLLTGHWVHIDQWHLAFNLAGVWLVWLWCGPSFTPLRWLITVVLCSLSVTLCLLLLDPDVTWYRGFSGVLFGVFAAGSVAMLSRHRAIALVGLAVAGGKLLLDATGWQVLGVGLVTDFRIIHQAHLYGFLSGGVLGLIWVAANVRSGSGSRRSGN